MAFISTTIRRLPALKRLPSRPIASRGRFLLATVPLLFLSSVVSGNPTMDYPGLPPATIASAEGSANPGTASELPPTKPPKRGVAGVVEKSGYSVRSLLTIVEELLTGGFLVPQTGDPVYGSPLGGKDSLPSETKQLAVQEKSLLISESFQIHGTDGPYCEVKRVKGMRLLLTGKDKLRFYLGSDKKHVATLETEDDTHVWDVIRGQGNETIGQIKRAEDGKFEFHSAESPVTNGTSSNTTAAYSLEGDFINRRFVMRNDKREIVAKIKKQLIAFPAFDHYEVRIAPGMDPVLAIASTCVVDEELDEELKTKIEERAKRDVRAVGSIAVSVGKKVGAFLNPFN